MKHFLYLFAALFAFNKSYSQTELTTINHIDSNKMKQGRWVFFYKSRDTALICHFNNDTLVGNRYFYKNNKLEIIRKPRENKEEHFEYFANGQTVSGKYTTSGEVVFQTEKDDKYQEEIRNIFFKEIPAIYNFGTGTFSDFLQTKLEHLPKRLAKGRVVLRLAIGKNGLLNSVTVLSGEISDKNKERLLKIFETMPRWQPAFQIWDCPKMEFKIPLDFQ